MHVLTYLRFIVLCFLSPPFVDVCACVRMCACMRTWVFCLCVCVCVCVCACVHVCMCVCAWWTNESKNVQHWNSIPEFRQDCHTQCKRWLWWKSRQGAITITSWVQCRCTATWLPVNSCCYFNLFVFPLDDVQACMACSSIQSVFFLSLSLRINSELYPGDVCEWLDHLLNENQLQPHH